MRKFPQVSQYVHGVRLSVRRFIPISWQARFGLLQNPDDLLLAEAALPHDDGLLSTSRP